MAFNDDGWVKPYYLDASAMVMLVVDEGDCAAIRHFYNTETNFCSTPLCLAEALGVLKRKRDAGQLTVDMYFRAAQELVIDAWGEKIRIDDLGLFDPAVLAQVEARARAHGLDISDALQLETIKKGYYSAALVGRSAPVLITGDRRLAEAATTDGIRVWNCRQQETPPWLAKQAG